MNTSPIRVYADTSVFVHFQKIPLYQGVNLVNGYEEIHIYSPLEVINYEGEEL